MMHDNDFNIIQPVENLQNVGALSPLDRHPEKKRKHYRQNEHSSPDEQQDSEQDKSSNNNNPSSGSIDYRA